MVSINVEEKILFRVENHVFAGEEFESNVRVIQIPMSTAQLFLRIFSYIPRSIPFSLCFHVRQRDKVFKMRHVRQSVFC